MKSLLILAIAIIANFYADAQYVNDFETGYKYVLDNQDKFQGMNEDQFLMAIQKQFNISTAIRIQTLDEVLAAGNHPWSPELTSLLTSYVQGTNTAKSYEEFIKSLMTFEQGSSRLSSEERSRVLQFIKKIREVVELLRNELQFYINCCEYEVEMATWWERWGRCAAAIVGGMGSGALAGAVAGTDHLPGLGTLAGAAIGAVAGGLTGAVAGC